MEWVLVGLEAIDSFREREPDSDVRARVLEWLMGFYEGPGFSNGVPSLTQAGLFVARVPETNVIVTYYLAVRLDPPAVAIRDIS